MQLDDVTLRVPDIAAALDGWSRTVPGARGLSADETWGAFYLDVPGAQPVEVIACSDAVNKSE